MPLFVKLPIDVEIMITHYLSYLDILNFYLKSDDLMPNEVIQILNKKTNAGNIFCINCKFSTNTEKYVREILKDIDNFSNYVAHDDFFQDYLNSMPNGFMLCESCDNFYCENCVYDCKTCSTRMCEKCGIYEGCKFCQ